MSRPVLTPLDGTGIIDTDELVNLAVTAAKLAADAVETAKILNAAVTTAKLADDAVTTAKINDGDVTTGLLAGGAVTSTKLAGSAVTTAAIADDAVTTAKIADNAVTSVKMSANQVTTRELAPDGVETGNILDANVTTAKIADTAVTEAKLDSDVLSSGWTSVPTATGWSTASNGEILVKKVGNILYVIGLVEKGTGGTTTICTLPSGLRPSITRRKNVVGSDIAVSPEVGQITYNTDGTITALASEDDRYQIDAVLPA